MTKYKIYKSLRGGHCLVCDRYIYGGEVRTLDVSKNYEVCLNCANKGKFERRREYKDPTRMTSN